MCMPTIKLVEETSTSTAKRMADMERIAFIDYSNVTDFKDLRFILYG